MNIKKVNAFTDTIDGGNPAGVVLHPQNISVDQMKQITRILVVSETAYVFPSTQAEYKLRFFSPEVEVDLCGHATIATFFTMAEEGFFPRDKRKITLHQETNVGILPIDVYYQDHHCEKVMMTQGNPIVKDIQINKHTLAHALHIDESQIDDSLPTQIASTGLFTLPICIKTLKTLQIMKPDFELIQKICTKINVGSFHVFSFETLEEQSLYHARNFAPLYVIHEDPVTGTANGAVGSYLVKNKIISDTSFICEQGDIIGRPGRVSVDINNNHVRVGGKAQIVEEREIQLE